MTDKDLLEEDPSSKKPALKMVIAQIENTRVGLLREILALGKERPLEVATNLWIKAIDAQLNVISARLKLLTGWFLIISFGLIMIFYELYTILDKLTALGL